MHPPSVLLDASHRSIAVALLSALAGAALVVFALTDPIAILSGRAAWFLAVTGAACALFAIAEWHRARTFGLALVAMFVGGAAQLYVTEPWFYATLKLPPAGEEYGMYAIVVVQALFVGFFARSHVDFGLCKHIAKALGRKRLAILALVSVLFAYPILGFVQDGRLDLYAANLFVGMFILVINVSTLAVVVATAPSIPSLPSGRHLVIFGVAAFLILAVLGAVFAFEMILHVDDELAYVFQARTYAGGALSVAPLPEGAQPAFDHYLLEEHDGRWISVLTPGWPAVLTIGVLAGVPWLVNPVLGALSVALAYAVLRQVAVTRTVTIAVLLVSLSPWFIALSGSFMAHTLALALVLFSWLMVLAGQGKREPRAAAMAFAAGLAMGWLLLTRNLDGLLMGVVTGIFMLLYSAKTRRLGPVLGYGLGCIASGSLIFAYNMYFTGDPLKTTLSAYYERNWIGGSNAYGFGDGIGPPEPWGLFDLWPHEHSLAEALLNALNSLSALHTDFMGWGVGSLVFFWAFLLWGRPNRFDWFMLAVIGVTIIGHLFYWFGGSHYVGARYWFMTFFPLAYLSARGIEALQTKLAGAGVTGSDRAFDKVIVVLCLFSVLVFLSFRDTTRYFEHRFHHDGYRRISIPDTGAGPEPLVIVRNHRRIGSFLFFNDPWFRPESPIFAIDIGIEGNRETISAFPNRTVLYYDEREDAFQSR